MDLKVRALDHVDVYPVGLLADLRRGWRYATVKDLPASVTWRRKRVVACLSRIPNRIGRDIRSRRWHELRQYLNGYLAEPYYWPEDGLLTKCGRGWTKAGAMRSLRQRGWKH